MSRRFGVVLIDEQELIFRIYETTEHEWKLVHYHSSLLPKDVEQIETADMLELIGSFFDSAAARGIAEWKLASRQVPRKITTELTRALSLPIEPLSLHREQELLCKGMFTELW